MFNYSIDFIKLITGLLPVILRKNKLVTFIYCATKQLTWLYVQFIAYRTETLRYIAYSSLTADLEYLLNDIFNNGQTGIYVETNDVFPLYLYEEEENETDTYLWLEEESDITKPSFDANASETYIYDNSETLSNTSFTIKAPHLLTFNEDKMRSIVNEYKIAGKTFNIQLY